MSLVEICKTLGLEPLSYSRQDPYFLDKWELEEILKHEWREGVVTFSHGISIAVNQDFLDSYGLMECAEDGFDAIACELDDAIWQEASEQFKDKLGKAIEFGGKL